jgi:serine/threonine protein kinase
MSSTPKETWQRRVDDKVAMFAHQGHALPLSIISEATFVDHFEALCRTYNERYVTRLLSQLQFTTINGFATALDALFERSPPKNLASAIFGGLYVVFEVRQRLRTHCQKLKIQQSGCMHQGTEVNQMIELLGHLNSLVPRLGQKIIMYPTDTKVQSPLQHIFCAYMDALLGTISRLTFTPPGKTPSAFPTSYVTSLANIAEVGDFDVIESIRTCIEEAGNIFDMGKSSFESNLDLAIRTEPRESHNPPYIFPNSHPVSNANLYDSQTKFRFLKRLGRGSYGEVDAVEEVTTKEVYARKYVALPPQEPDRIRREQDVLREVQIMKDLVYHHITQVAFPIREPEAFVIIINPAGEYDLWKYLEKCSLEKFPQTSIKSILPWFGCLSDALAFAHRNKILHQDIKPSNIIIKGLKVYLADFGLARDFKAYDTSKTSNYHTCGTPIYRAPEVKPDSPRGRQADVFSLGCVFSEMISVYCRHSMDEYQQARRLSAADNEHGSVAFRDSLPAVNRWLWQLHQNTSDPVGDTLFIQISIMLRELPDTRGSAQQAVNTFLTQQTSLFCDAH